MNTFLLHHLLMASSEKHPDKDAIILSDQSITYSDLNYKSNQIGSALTRMGVKKGDCVGLLFRKSIESIIAIFGILKTGASYVPIDPIAPANRMKYIISNCDIKCLILSGDLTTKITPEFFNNSPLKNALVSEGSGEELAKQSKTLDVVSWEEAFRVESEDYRIPTITDNYPAYILHTSGSTGTPKGVVISHLNSLTFVNMAADFFGVSEKDRFSNHAPLYFDLSVFDIFVAVKSGATVVLIPERLSVFPMELARYIDDNKISVWNSVSSVLALLAERGRLENFRFESLRLVHFSGEILPVKYLRKVKAHMPKADFFNIYGQTEANSSMYYQINKIPNSDAWKIPIGKPFPNFEVFALNDDNKIIDSPGEEGELFVKASSVAMGYWRDSERTAASFVRDPLQPLCHNWVYKTGDIVCLNENSDYVFTGRKDHMVKSKGYRIEIGEIELAIYSYPRINQAAVIPVPDDLIGNRIIAFVSATDGEKIQAKDILNHCSQQLPKYMIPEAVEFRQKLPATSTGKIDRKKLAREVLSNHVRTVTQ